MVKSQPPSAAAAVLGGEGGIYSDLPRRAASGPRPCEPKVFAGVQLPIRETNAGRPQRQWHIA
jgi:hypothetical protein